MNVVRQALKKQIFVYKNQYVISIEKYKKLRQTADISW